MIFIKRFFASTVFLFFSVSLFANAPQPLIEKLTDGYVFRGLPAHLMKDFLFMEKPQIKVSVLHPNQGVESLEGYALPYGLREIKLFTHQRLAKLPDNVNLMILFDATDNRQKREHYRHLDNHIYWTLMPIWENPDNLTGIPTGPQPYYCGPELCACVIGADDEASCDGMSLVAKGKCRTDDGIKLCCQTAGTKPVDTNGGQTTTCQ